MSVPVKEVVVGAFASKGEDMPSMAVGNTPPAAVPKDPMAVDEHNQELQAAKLAVQ